MGRPCHATVKANLVLNDFEGPDTGALNARPGQVEAAIADRPQQNGAGRREIGIGIEVAANPDGMGEDGLIDVLGGIDVVEILPAADALADLDGALLV